MRAMFGIAQLRDFEPRIVERPTVALRDQPRPASCKGERHGLGGAAGAEEIAEQRGAFACADAAVNLKLMIEAPVAAEVED
jgi:hypothetical protein